MKTSSLPVREPFIGPEKSSMKFRWHLPAQLFSNVSTKSTFLRNPASQKKSRPETEKANFRTQLATAGRHRTSFYLGHQLLWSVAAVIILTIMSSAEAVIDAQNTLSCHRRQYRYKITETDASGRACWDYVNVMSCWGRCESHEIADWKFPYKRSHHPVCQHAGTKESEVILRNCDAGVAAGTEVHKFTEAAVCACALCKSSETSCEGLRFRGVRRAPREAGSSGIRDPGTEHGKGGDGDREVTGISKREHIIDVEVAGPSDDVGTRRLSRDTSALMVARHGNFADKLDQALARQSARYEQLAMDESAHKFKGMFKHAQDESYGHVKRSSDGSFARVQHMHDPLYPSPSRVPVKKDQENLEISADGYQTAPYPDYEDDDDEDEEFFYEDEGSRAVRIGATGKGVISSASAAQRPKENEEFLLKSSEEAAEMPKLSLLRKQLNERDDEKTPSFEDVVRMIANYRKLEQFARGRSRRNSLHNEFVVE
ncbi:Cystine-knot cytokine [Trinorchestia longiramus]|nr:Cystine-knot cytokine [Trinorchestia longiramus]